MFYKAFRFANFDGVLRKLRFEVFSTTQALLLSFTSEIHALFYIVTFFYLGVNTFCLKLSADLSSCVPPKRKREIEKNETEQPAGRVHEMQQ